MKKLLLVFCVLTFSICRAQVWQEFNGGTNYEVYSINVYNGELYVGGYFDSAANVPARGIVKWNGNNWVSLGHSDWINNFLEIYNSKLYLGSCYFDTLNPIINTLAKWDGSIWDSAGQVSTWDYLTCAKSFNNELYVGGKGMCTFDSINSDMAKWNDTCWSSVGTSVGPVSQLKVFQNELYAIASFGSLPPTPYFGVAKSNGTTWTSLYDTLFNSYDAFLLEELNNELYLFCTSSFLSANPFELKILKLVGQSWIHQITFPDFHYSEFYPCASVTFNGKIYFGGVFTFTHNNDTAFGLASWEPISNNIELFKCNPSPSAVFALYVDTTIQRFYAGGAFNSIDGAPIRNLAYWDLPNIAADSTNEFGDEYIFPNLILQSQSSVITIANFIKDKEHRVKIYDATGNKIVEQTTFSNQFNFDAIQFSRGVYLCKIVSDANVFTGKLIIQ